MSVLIWVQFVCHSVFLKEIFEKVHFDFKLLLRRYSRVSDLNINKDQRKKHPRITTKEELKTVL